MTVVPRDHAEFVIAEVAKLVTRETSRIKEIQQGGLFKAEIDDTLRKHGVID